MFSFLTPSGTDVEMLSSSIVSNNYSSPITNFVLAPAEIGSGSVNSVGGRISHQLLQRLSRKVGSLEFSNLETNQ